MPITRNSNIELLRIISMLMVVMLHFNSQCAYPGVINLPADIGTSAYPGFLIEVLCIVAVNCFVLISGYFGIHLKLRSVLRLYLQCFFIGLISYLLYVALTPATIALPALLERLLAFTHNNWWFIISYLGLMVLSPLLNAAVAQLSKKQLALSIGLLAVVIWYFGFKKNPIYK